MGDKLQPYCVNLRFVDDILGIVLNGVTNIQYSVRISAKCKVSTFLSNPESFLDIYISPFVANLKQFVNMST